MMKERRKKLHVKLTLLYSCFAVVVGVFISLFGYYIMFRLATDIYSEKAMQAAAVAASYVDGDTIVGYLDTMETDAAYEEMRERLGTIKEDLGLAYLYVFLPGTDSFTYLVEAQVAADDPAYISTLGDIYEYTDWEYEHLLPDVEAKRASQEGLLSMENPFFGVGVSAWVPVMDSQGELTVMVEADIHLDQVLSAVRSALVLMLVGYVGLIIVMILMQAFSIRKMISIPLHKLTDRTLQFATGGKLSGFEDDIRTNDELQSLSEAFGQMARDISAYTEERADLAAVKERIATELEVATDIQQSMLPEKLPDFSGRKYLDIEGQLHASKNMGGAFYDYFVLDNYRVGVVVCGTDQTGIPAAMMMVVTRTIIKSQFSGERSLSDTIGEVNQQVYDFMEHKQPIHTFIGVLDLREGVFSYINAGYNPPVLLRQGERYELLIGTVYTPLGMERNVVYRELQVQLRQRDRLLFYSNGVVDAKNSGGTLYGTERLCSKLNETRGMDTRPQELIDYVVASVMEFTGNTAPDTDMILLALEYKRGNRELARCRLFAEPVCAPELRDFLREQLAANHIVGKDYALLLVCAEELFTICCRYAAGGYIDLTCMVPQPDRLELHFTADFHGANPLAEDAGKSVENALSFVRKNVNQLYFDCENGQTALVMKKNFHAEQAVSEAVR